MQASLGSWIASELGFLVMVLYRYLTLINTTRVAHEVLVTLLLDLRTFALLLMFNTTCNLPWSDMRRRFLLCERRGET